MVGFVGCKRYYNRKNEPEVHDLSTKFQFQSSGGLDCPEFRGFGSDYVGSFCDVEIELNRLR